MGLIFAEAAMGGRLGLDVVDLIIQAGPIVKLVLLLLAVTSIISWAIIALKWRELRRAEQDSEAFLEVYHEGSMESAYAAARELDRSPLSSIFRAGSGELRRLLAGQTVRGGLDAAQLRILRRTISWTASREGLRLERGLAFLATTGSAAPFVGLFGTVVGIINSFQGIGRAGSASLAVVAPGIAEALIATAMGLFAAIPATVFYNYFVAEMRRITAAVDLFTAELESDLSASERAVEQAVRAAGGP